LFQAAGAALAYVSSYVFTSYKTYDHFLEDKYTLIPAIVILAVAVVMFIIGTIGCCATLRESRIGLGFFLFIILLLFVAEVAAFVLGFIYRARVSTDVKRSMSDVFNKYDGHNAETGAVDYLQKQLQCCGVKSYNDWNTTSWFNSTGNSTVPLSCCKVNNNNCTGRIDQPSLLYTQGCEEKLEHVLQEVLSYAMLVILGFAIIKFFGMLSVCVITCKKRNQNEYQPLSGTFA
ncbi:TSN3 protein, partial [Amia calva]|nr:TSN3 protein [Amia calva]